MFFYRLFLYFIRESGERVAKLGTGCCRHSPFLYNLTMKPISLFFLLAVTLWNIGCTKPTPASEPFAEIPARLRIGEGYTLEVAFSGLQNPTQIILADNGKLWVAQLAGGENAGTGQLLTLSLETGQQQLLLDNLFKPTGIALLENHLWIASGNSLLRGPLLNDGSVGNLETILADLPFNGRSNGTLTVTSNGKLIYETSGTRQGNQAAAGSATLWELDPANLQTHPLATGLKGAYAHLFDEQGRLWVTEIGDDRVNGDVPPDELNLVLEGADFGYPRCFGWQEPALNFGGTEKECAGTRPPVALFPPQSTPVSLAISPWQADTLLVALWVQNEIVQIPLTYTDDNATGEPQPFLQGLFNPQQLLVLKDGSLLVSEFATGTIYRIVKR